MHKTKKSTREDTSTNISTDDLILSSLNKESLLKLHEKIVDKLQEHDVSREELLKIPGDNVPVEIFSEKLSPAEAVVKYLKENAEMRLRQIALSLGRDERGIWGSYARARKKQPASFRIVKSVVQIPVKILKNRQVSMLEAVVFYLKETERIEIKEISRLLSKSPSTIYTALTRAKKKLEVKK
ncbi:MAG: sigma-70 region 4 domain-containing protein [Nanoarchaeota archaeon]|nr:sigma-70 region 4 domain-containing protein [Nanoarchaeota archaeon]